MNGKKEFRSLALNPLMVNVEDVWYFKNSKQLYVFLSSTSYTIRRVDYIPKVGIEKRVIYCRSDSDFDWCTRNKTNLINDGQLVKKVHDESAEDDGYGLDIILTSRKPSRTLGSTSQSHTSSRT